MRAWLGEPNIRHLQQLTSELRNGQRLMMNKITSESKKCDGQARNRLANKANKKYTIRNQQRLLAAMIGYPVPLAWALRC